VNAQPVSASDNAATGGALTDAELVQLARRISNFRRKRDTAFQQLMFADPEWDILLDLFAEGGFGRRVSMSSLCIAAAVPTTTAVRCINAMIDQGVLTKSRDAGDARRVLIALTEASREKMRGLLLQAAQIAIGR
jgi:DNA-binding MarR family transcriptional regulator